MSVDFEKEFEAALESLQEASDEELAAQIEQYHSDLQDYERELAATGNILVDGSAIYQQQDDVRAGFENEASRRAQRVGKFLVEATYQLSTVTAEVAKEVAVVVAELSSESTGGTAETYVRKRDEPEVSSEMSVQPEDEHDSTLDMVA